VFLSLASKHFLGFGYGFGFNDGFVRSNLIFWLCCAAMFVYAAVERDVKFQGESVTLWIAIALISLSILHFSSMMYLYVTSRRLLHQNMARYHEGDAKEGQEGSQEAEVEVNNGDEKKNEGGDHQVVAAGVDIVADADLGSNDLPLSLEADCDPEEQ
jgi:hypothetical protein